MQLIYLKSRFVMFLLIASFFNANLGASSAKKKHKFKARTTMQMRATRIQKLTDEANKELAEIPGCDYKEMFNNAKPIIRQAIIQGVHPDKLILWHRPVLICCLTQDDLGLARFILKKRGDAKIKFYGRPAIWDARTVPMAELLVRHAGKEHIKTDGTDLICHNLCHNSPALIHYYLANGANPNRFADEGMTPLAHFIKDSFDPKSESVVALVRAGASLAIKSKGKTAPQLLKQRLVAAEGELRVNRIHRVHLLDRCKPLVDLRTHLKEEHDKSLEQQRKFCAKLLPKGMPDECVEYITSFLKPTYDELEALPVVLQSSKDEKTNQEKAKDEKSNAERS